MDEWIYGWMNEWMNEWVIGWINKLSIILLTVFSDKLFKSFNFRFSSSLIFIIVKLRLTFLIRDDLHEMKRFLFFNFTILQSNQCYEQVIKYIRNIWYICLWYLSFIFFSRLNTLLSALVELYSFFFLNTGLRNMRLKMP